MLACWTRRLLSICLLLAILGLSTLVATNAQSEPEEPELPPVNGIELFPNDVDSPLCWFRLCIEVSTREDVYQFFVTYRDLFWNDFRKMAEKSTGEVRYLNLIRLFNEEELRFYWLESSYQSPTSISNYIVLHNGLITAIRIKPTASILLHEVLGKFQRPVIIRAGSTLYYERIVLYYPEYRTIIELVSDREDCVIHDFLNKFQVEAVSYLSLGEYDQQIEREHEWSSLVSPDIWEGWITEADNTSCYDAIQAIE